jgi:hypothetical protein
MAAQLAKGAYAATSDWVQVGGGPEDWDLKPQVIRSVAGSILALTQDADRANDLAGSGPGHGYRPGDRNGACRS